VLQCVRYSFLPRKVACEERGRYNAAGGRRKSATSGSSGDEQRAALLPAANLLGVYDPPHVVA
jgi:hypothetical protein